MINPVLRIRTSPINTDPIDEPIMRCYVCGRLSVSKFRVINRQERLAICNPCDGVESRDIRQEEVTISGEPPHIVTERIRPQDAVCAICHKPLINTKQIARRLKKVEGCLSQQDTLRIQREQEHKGWKNIGNNTYAHNRCTKVKRRK